MSIKDWPADDRPREKLLALGADALSDAELLAIFLRIGVTGKSAVELARDLLQRFGSVAGIEDADGNLTHVIDQISPQEPLVGSQVSPTQQVPQAPQE